MANLTTVEKTKALQQAVDITKAAAEGGAGQDGCGTDKIANILKKTYEQLTKIYEELEST